MEDLLMYGASIYAWWLVVMAVFFFILVIAPLMIWHYTAGTRDELRDIRVLIEDWMILNAGQTDKSKRMVSRIEATRQPFVDKEACPGCGKQVVFVHGQDVITCPHCYEPLLEKDSQA